MTKRLSLISGILLACLPNTPLFAQESATGVLTVPRPSINAEQDAAELCLDFDEALDLSDRGRILSALQLQQGNKTIALSPLNLNLSPYSLCVQSLAHQTEYSLTVTNLKGANGERLKEPYKLSFTVPDRSPSLVFVGDAVGGRLPRIKDSDLMLHTVNVSRAMVFIYRIADPARMAEAYTQRQQTALAPSESITFAKTYGQLIWQGEMVLQQSEEKKPTNTVIDAAIPHGAISAAGPSGLYLVAALDEDPPTHTAKVTVEKDESEKPAQEEIAPLAAEWFVHSNLKLSSFRTDKGLEVETESDNGEQLMPNVKALVFGHEQQPLADTTVDATGLGLLELTPDKSSQAATMVGLSETGDVDFEDLTSTSGPQDRFVLPKIETNLRLDKSSYAPDAEAFLTLSARDIHGAAFDAKESDVALMRPDRSFYRALSLPPTKAGVSYLNFRVPPVEGVWVLGWRAKDGHSLAEIPLRITANTKAPRFAIDADRPALSSQGDITLTIKSLAQDNTPSHYVPGRVLVQWKEPDLVPSSRDYHFGENEKTIDDPQKVAAFITDEHGLAVLHLNLLPPNDQAPLHTAVVTLVSDTVAGALGPEALLLPVKPDRLVIGIKPLAQDGRFAENSDAGFDVIALDGDARRKDDAGLKYQIFEEGRSFAWYQDEGRWNYKPLRQQRRIGGGTIDIKANGSNMVHWPVTAGAYLIEVTDANGGSLAKFHFDAGWGFLKTGTSDPLSLSLTPIEETATAQQPVTLKFVLPRKAVITAVIADDQVRKIIHEARSEGDNTISFTPDQSWGRHLKIGLEVSGQPRLIGQLEMPLSKKEDEVSLNLVAPQQVAAGGDLILSLEAKNQGQQSFVSLLATPRPDQFDDALASTLLNTIVLDADGKATIHLTVPNFSGVLDLALIVANDKDVLRKDLSVPVRAAVDAHLSARSFWHKGDEPHLTLEIENNELPAGVYHYILSGGPDLKLAGSTDGRISLKTGEKKSLSFTLTAVNSGTHAITAEIIGPHDAHFVRNWPITVIDTGGSFQQVSTLVLESHKALTQVNLLKGKPKGKDEDTFVLVAPEPMFGAPSILPDFLKLVPFSTSEMADWLETIRLWRNLIIDANLTPATALQRREDETLKRLLARQNADGSFPERISGEGDALSTASALKALAHADPALKQAAEDGAIAWLQKRVSNTWFDEKERPSRAAVFASLATVDRLDVAAVRYFAETSNGKPLPPLAMADLAFALAKINDQDKANQWLRLLHDHLLEELDFLPWAAETPLVKLTDLRPAYDKLTDDVLHHSKLDFASLSLFLRSVGLAEERHQGWVLNLNGADKKLNGIFVIAPSKTALSSIQNPTDSTLSIEVFARGEKDPSMNEGKSAPILRRFYKMDGSEIAASQLHEGEVYLIRLDGKGSISDLSAGPVLVHDGAGNIFHPLSCILDAETLFNDPWRWMETIAPNHVEACEAGGAEINSVLLAPKGAKSWHAAYIAELLQAGSFEVPAPSAWSTVDGWSKGTALHIKVQ